MGMQKMINDFFESQAMKLDLKVPGLKEIVKIEEELKRSGKKFTMLIQVTQDLCQLQIRKQEHYYADVNTELLIEERSGDYQTRKKLSIGVDSYAKLKSSNLYYIDKTRMIEEFLSQGDEVTLITRPRRFGKTLNMSMMAEFFDIAKDSRTLFEDTYISKTCYVSEMNQYPVIYMSFKDCKGQKMFMLIKIYHVLKSAYEILQDDQLKDERLKSEYQNIYEILYSSQIDEINLSRISEAICFLCKAYHSLYEKPVLLLLDEYDIPFLSAYSGGYYEEVKDFLSGLLSSSLKGNPYLYRAVLTGIQRIAKENIFSGLNNLKVCTLQSKKYADCFGFTQEEAKALLQSYGLTLDEKVKQMYDGYRIGQYEIYNPWSVLQYADEKVCKCFWVNTSENTLIHKLLLKANQNFFNQFQELLYCESVRIVCDLDSCYYEHQTSSYLWALLVNAGYLTISDILGNNHYVLRIVNGEVKEEFIRIINTYLGIDDSSLADTANALMNGDVESFKQKYESILLNIISYHDLKDENSYHLLMLVICMSMSSQYEIMSNKETGMGRADIYLKSKKQGMDIILEFKYANKETYDKEKDCLKKLAEKALAQIVEKKYAMQAHVLMIGIAHHGKACEIVWREEKRM